VNIGHAAARDVVVWLEFPDGGTRKRDVQVGSLRGGGHPRSVTIKTAAAQGGSVPRDALLMARWRDGNGETNGKACTTTIFL
jgi:hypothetical protein